VGLLTSSRNGAGQAVGYGHDLKSQVTSLSYPNGETVTRTYDDAGRWTSVSDWLGQTTTFGYDADANLNSQAYPNTTRATLDYDPAARLMGIDHTRSGATLAGFDYGRDNNDLLTSTATTGLTQASETYAYTALDQLKSVNGATYSYDAADNLTKLFYDHAQFEPDSTRSGQVTDLASDGDHGPW
jgi:YD repeat-containing protein